MTDVPIIPLVIGEELALERRWRAARAVIASSVSHSQDRTVAQVLLDFTARRGHALARPRADDGSRRVSAIADRGDGFVELAAVVVNGEGASRAAA